MNQPESIIQPTNFSSVFDQMCNFIAVAKTGDPRETTRGLIRLCLLSFPDQHFAESGSLRDKILATFGITIPKLNIEQGLEELEQKGVLSKPAGTNYVLSQDARKELQDKVDGSSKLEEKVKVDWLTTLSISYPNLDSDTTWEALQTYLSRTFRRHGVQAVALLDPSIQTPAGYDTSLTAMLSEAIADHFEYAHQKQAREAVSEFLATLGSNYERMVYVSQLADGAFSFYTLQIPDELGERLRKGLSDLTVFLDTNFVFGILDLHHNSQVEVSLELLRAIKAHNLPFKLRYHEATAKELRNTIGWYGGILRSRDWKPSLSRAAAASHNLSGIEQKFHESNSGQKIDVDEFLRTYEHYDVILKEKDIHIYRTADERAEQQNSLYQEYKTFLEKVKRSDKMFETVMHDAIVLDCTRQLRKATKSSLEAGSLFVSCDYLLYRFECEAAQKENRPTCVVVPNVLWQILRPFIPPDIEFDRAFAQTFALPEFRAMGGGGNKACSKMIQILATYKDVPEETAFRLLSSDVLINQLKSAQSDKEFNQYIEAAFVEENKSLMEEKATIAAALEKEQRETQTMRQTFLEREKIYEERVKRLEEAIRLKDEKVAELETLATATKAEEVVAPMPSSPDEDLERKTVGNTIPIPISPSHFEPPTNRMAIVAAIAVSLLLVLLFVIAVHNLQMMLWIAAHKNAVSLQIGISAAILFITVGAFVRKWRGWCLGTGVFGIFVVLLSLL